MSEEQQEPRAASEMLTRLAFAMHENRGIYGLLLGSGLSRAAGILTGWGMTLDLIRRVGGAEGVEHQEDWAAWYRERVGREPDYSDLVTELGASRDERRAILDGYIEPTAADREAGRKMPTRAHRAIADLVYDGFVRVIVTTNFDRLLESALRDRGVEPTVVASVDAIKGAEPLTHTKCYLLKLHGDYKDARILNTEGELSTYPVEYDALLNRIFDEHGLVVCGWSGEWDEALRAALMRNESRRYSLFWAAQGEVRDAAARIVGHRRGHLLSIVDADGFFGRLRDQVQALVRTRQREPRTVELLVGSAKRVVARTEHRVELDDLVESEVHTAQRELRAFRPVGGLDKEGIRGRVEFHESAAEPLARIVGVLGRWGDGEEVDVAINAVLVLVAQADEERNGIVQLVGLRAYAAVLLLTAYGLGLTYGRRWDTLYRLLSHPVAGRFEGDPQRVVDRFFLWSWEGADDQVWRQLPGLDRHRTPLSDRMFEVMDGWRDSFAGVVADFDDLYDTWEILGALAFCDKLPQEQLESDGGRTWIPVGRNGWRYLSRRRILDRLLKGAVFENLVAAGFGGGSAERLAKSAQRYERFAAELNWWI